MRRELILGLVLLCASSAWATTYYVDPDTGDNANAGTSSSAPWRNPPGTRNTSDTGFYSAAWGAITGSTSSSNVGRIQCGDLLLFLPGAAQSSAQGGGWCISSTGGASPGTCNGTRWFYATGCTLSNPITLRIADSSEWPGAPSTGNFTVDGSDINAPEAFGFDYSGLLAIGGIDGLRVLGLDANRRFRFTGSKSGEQNPCNLAIASTTGSENDGLIVDWVELDNGSTGLCFADTINWRISNALIHDNDCHGADLGYHTDRQYDAGALVDVEIYQNGQDAGCVGFNSDGMYQQGARRIWNVRVSVHDEQTNCVNGGSAMQVGGGLPQGATFRSIFRDGHFYKCGVNSIGARAGIAWDGDGDTTSPHSYVFFQQVIAYGNRGPGIWSNHGTGRMNVWHATTFGNDHGGNARGEFWYDRTGDLLEIHNSILNPPRAYSSSGSLFKWNTSNGIFNSKPLSNFNLYDYLSGVDDQLSDFSYSTAWPATGGDFQSDDVSYGNAASSWNITGGNDFISDHSSGACTTGGGGRCQARHASVGGTCDTAAGSYASCDFRLCTAAGQPTAGCAAASDAIDRGTFFLRASGAGSGTTVTVRRGDPLSALGGTDADAVAEYSDPRNFFIAPSTYPGASGDVIQIKGGDCTGGAAAYGNAERAKIVSMTATTITVDRDCTWDDDAGVHRIWYGAAPDMGALESGGDCHGDRY